MICVSFSLFHPHVNEATSCECFINVYFAGCCSHITSINSTQTHLEFWRPRNTKTLLVSTQLPHFTELHSSHKEALLFFFKDMRDGPVP